MTDNTQETEQEIERLPITILTGFLGSGKTTLLKNLLQQDDMANTAVVINEFGEVGLDHMLVETATEDMIVMDSGCLCCTIRGDLIETLRRLLKQRWNGEIPKFDRLMIETTGLADPAPILHTIITDAVISHRYRLDGIVTCVDTINAMDQMDKQPEAVKQAAVADKLLLTKTDLVKDEAALNNLEIRLKDINPAATVTKPIQGKVAASELTGFGLFDPATKTSDVKAWMKEEAYKEDHDHHHHDHHHGHGHDHGHHHHDVNRHGDGIKAFVFEYEEPIKWDSFVDWMESMLATHGANLLRMKGILNVVEAEGPVVVHGVQHVFHPPAQLEKWPDDNRKSRLVMITRNINKEPIEATFKSFMAL
ncbi:CobW family GTP-binding protein [Curvivirga sp.]|uniref:CobW family GTP-binding protein n=1 Tax=Curvivirga sp. TaxID=2856848 RepID=UPI003B5C8A3C